MEVPLISYTDIDPRTELAQALNGLYRSMGETLLRGVSGSWDHYDIGSALMDEGGLLRLALAFMRSQGAKVRDPTVQDLEKPLMLAEFGYVCGTDPEAEKETFLSIHQDDFGGVSGQVWTVIFYIRSDIEGGALALYSSEKAAEPYARINPRAPQEGWVRAVVMRGDVWHVPERVSGIGERAVVVLQLPRADEDHKQASANAV